MQPRDLVLALTVVVIWGLNFIAIKWSVAEISPFMLTALRYIGCAIPAIFFVRRPKVSLRLLMAYGLSVGVLQFGFLFFAMREGMPAGLASLIMQMQAFFTMALAVMLLGDRPAWVQWTGAGAALVGLAVIAGEHIGGAVLMPLLLTVAGAFFWAVSNIVTKRAGKIDMLGFVIWGALVPPLPMLALALMFDGPAAFTGLLNLSHLAIGSVLFIAYASTLVGYCCWAYLLGRHPASLIAPFTLMVPIIGMIAAYFILGEGVTGFEIVGSALIFLGLLFNVFGPHLLSRLRSH
jgi:O-acetylserine/cysteine efflux transporter